MTAADRPAIIAPPPLLYVAAFAIAIVLHWIWPVSVVDMRALAWAGGAITVLGIALNFWGAYSMRQARTPINPYKPVEAIVDSGAFRVSRNPLYVGLNLVFVGLTLLVNSVWGIVVLIPLLLIMHYGVVLPEERYLETRFQDVYREYAARVRRYL